MDSDKLLSMKSSLPFLYETVLTTALYLNKFSGILFDRAWLNDVKRKISSGCKFPDLINRSAIKLAALFDCVEIKRRLFFTFL